MIMMLVASRSALHLAARGGQAGALKALLEDLDEEERVAFLNDPDKNGITPVFLAKQKGHCFLPMQLLAGSRKLHPIAPIASSLKSLYGQHVFVVLSGMLSPPSCMSHFVHDRTGKYCMASDFCSCEHWLQDD